MKRTKIKKLFSALLALLLLVSLAPGAFAAGRGGDKEPEPTPEPEKPQVRIFSERQFAGFIRDCSRESYSSGVRFLLMRDLDLGGAEFESTAYFAGEFDGRGHTIRGLAVTGAGSRLGLFREIGPEASVEGLTVECSILPAGTREYLGGLAGVNAGTVKNCHVIGELAGTSNVGGLVGLNRGTLSGCSFEGAVSGEHQIGGVAGRNEGVLFNCENRGAVNTVAVVPEGGSHFDLAALSQDDFVDIANIGGVAGENAGVMRFCRNSGEIGFSYTGYNVGGVAGKNNGLVDSCKNTGSVEGRRDVGGVVGQSIPYAAWELSEGKLQDLSKAITALNAMLLSTSAKLNDGTGQVRAMLEAMSGYSGQATGAIRQLLDAGMNQTANYLAGITVDPVTGEITLPNVNYAAADTSALTAAMNNLFAQSAAVSGALSGTVGGMADDFRGVTRQMSYVFELLFSMMDEVGKGDLISTRDLSLDEAYDHDEGAVARCSNSGAVRADVNAGGVVGTLALEVSFDMEDTLGSSDYLPTHAERILFGVVRACDNTGEVQSRGDAAGGVVGRLDVGAAVDCSSVGAVSARGGDYVGGVAGRAAGALARCWSRSCLDGGKYVGGIAGLGKNITDCRAWTHIARGTEYLGAVAGWADGTVSGNLYADGRPDGVDGVSRIGQAEPLKNEDFLALEGAPARIEDVTVRFWVEDELVRTLRLRFGEGTETLPQVENRGSAYWVWDSVDLRHVYSDTDVRGAYCSPATTLSGGGEIPRFLVEGEFYEGQVLTVEDYAAAPGDAGEHLGGYTLSVNGFEGMLTVRMRSDGGVAVYAQEESGAWRELDSEWDGRYLVFGLPSGGSFAVMAREQQPDTTLFLAAGVAGLLALILIVRGVSRRRRAKKADAAEAAAAVRADETGEAPEEAGPPAGAEETAAPGDQNS